MRKIIIAVLFCLLASTPAICDTTPDNGEQKPADAANTGIITDEAESYLKGFKKITPKNVLVVDEAEQILSRKGLQKTGQKNIIYQDLPVSKTSSEKVAYRDVVISDVLPPAAKTAKKHSYEGGIPVINAIPVKIATGKTIQSTLKFYRKNNIVYSYSIPLLNTKYEFRVVEDAVLNNRVIIPKGTRVYGYVTFNMSTADFIEISRFYFEKDGERIELLGTIGNGEFFSPGKPIENQPVSLLSFGTRTKIPFIKLGPPAYIKKNQPYTVYYEYK